MKLTKEQAKSALQDLEQAGNRSETLHKYGRTSPYLILWGVIWIAAYGSSDVFPAHAGMIWLAANGIGAIGSLYIALVRERTVRHPGRRGGAIAAVVVALTATLAVLSPYLGKFASALMPMLVAGLYVLFGIWHGRRLVIIGVLIGGLTALGFVVLPGHFQVWMAVVGGTALILTGVWLKKV